MNQIPADVQILLVVENSAHVIHAVAALASCGGVGWAEVHDCAAAVEWLHSHHADLVLVLLQSTILGGLALLRQSWQGPLVCLCDEDEHALSVVEAMRALAILPPFATRQIVNALRLFVGLGAALDALHEHDLRAEETLRESQRRLEQAQRMETVGRLAGGIAHDFNNLLTVIGSYSDLAARKLEDGHVVLRYVEQIRKASTTAATLTRQLLAFSRCQTSQPSVVTLNEIVDEISLVVQSLLGAGIEVRIELEPALGQIEADPVQLQQVLLNLIVNAKDAMPYGGLLNIETRNFEVESRHAHHFPNFQPGAYVRLTVADTGIGMDEEILTRIYEPFFTTKPKGRGTGLGLSTVHGIVQQSGGHIHVYSEVGMGTTFHLYFPRVDKKTESEESVAETCGAFHGRETILLVEDERGVRELTCTILQDAGYSLLAAGTPEEAMALEANYAGSIDLLLTDVIMPRMTGREVALKLACRRPQMAVVYMSGYTEDVMASQQLLDSGAYLVEKPFYPHELLRTVRRAIDQSTEPPTIYEMAGAVATGDIL
jgi:signal transduction histidine kinase